MWDFDDFISFINSKFPEFPCEYIETFGEEYWEDNWEMLEKYKKCNWYNF